jgi:hypothetical protein
MGGLLGHIPRRNVCSIFYTLGSATSIVHDHEHFREKGGPPFVVKEHSVEQNSVRWVGLQNVQHSIPAIVG